MVIEQAARVRRASSTVWMGVVALVVAAIWWYPTVRDRWLLPTEGDAAAGAPAGMGRGPGGAGPGGMRGTPVSVALARELDIRVSLNALGTFSALNTAVVRAKVDGELRAIRFKEGQEVKAGDVLAEIDPRSYQLALQQAQGQLARDQASLRNAELDLSRYRDLLAKDAIARQQVETQDALVKQLQGTVEADMAQVDNARLQLSYTQVTAPISGRLGLKQVELGSLVRASDLAGLVTITQTQPMALVFAVPDVHVGQIQRQLRTAQGLPVQALDRDGRALALGRVSAIDNSIDLSTGTLKLKALFDNPQGLLFPNQFAQARLQLDLLPQQLSVPTVAIQRGNMGTFVAKVLPDQRVRLTKVKLLGSDGDWQAIEPQGELKAGDAVVTDGADRLRDGSRVDVVTTLNPPLPTGLGLPAGPASAPGPAKGAAPAMPQSAASAPSPDAGPRPAWMDRLPPEVAAKVQAMSPEERRAYFQRMRERRQSMGQ